MYHQIRHVYDEGHRADEQTWVWAKAVSFVQFRIVDLVDVFAQYIWHTNIAQICKLIHMGRRANPLVSGNTVATIGSIALDLLRVYVIKDYTNNRRAMAKQKPSRKRSQGETERMPLRTHPRKTPPKKSRNQRNDCAIPMINSVSRL